MCPESVITSGNTEASVEVVSHSPEGSLALEWHPVSGNADFRFVSSRKIVHGSRTTHNPIKGMKMMNVVLSQLICLYQFFQVMGCSVI